MASHPSVSGYEGESEAGGWVEDSINRAVASHGYAIVNDIAPEHEMEKILYALDDLITRTIAAVQSFEARIKGAQGAIFRRVACWWWHLRH